MYIQELSCLIFEISTESQPGGGVGGLCGVGGGGHSLGLRGAAQETEAGHRGSEPLPLVPGEGRVVMRDAGLQR